jgi:hypothetical protein
MSTTEAPDISSGRQKGRGESLGAGSGCVGRSAVHELEWVRGMGGVMDVMGVAHDTFGA